MSSALNDNAMHFKLKLAAPKCTGGGGMVGGLESPGPSQSWSGEMYWNCSIVEREKTHHSTRAGPSKSWSGDRLWGGGSELGTTSLLCPSIPHMPDAAPARTFLLWRSGRAVASSLVQFEDLVDIYAHHLPTMPKYPLYAYMSTTSLLCPICLMPHRPFFFGNRAVASTLEQFEVSSAPSIPHMPDADAAPWSYLLWRSCCCLQFRAIWRLGRSVPTTCLCLGLPNISQMLLLPGSLLLWWSLCRV